MKLGAFTIAYNEQALIRGAINTWKPFVSKHIVMISTKPFFGAPEPMDRTYDICKEMGVTPVRGAWAEEHNMRNIAINLLRDCDYILVSDADMWMAPAEVEKMLAEIARTKQDAYVIPQKSYWKDTDHILVGEDFMPVVAVRPNVRFTHIGSVDRAVTVLKDPILHHLNWCAPKDIYRKITHYSHACEISNADEWYEYFKNWNVGDARMPSSNIRKTDLFGKTFAVKYDPMPAELKEWI